MRYRTNQTDWMVQIWDKGDGKFSDFWGVSTWSKSKKAGLKAAKECLRYNRGHDKIPRFRIVHIKDKDIKNLWIPVK
ncbi:MAG: hypothetical protein Q7R95_11370 [bacterium]|nr:hypothetical protein [bacterium]